MEDRKYVCLFRLVTVSTLPFRDIPIYNDFQTWRGIHIKEGEILTSYLYDSNVNALRVGSSMDMANKEKERGKQEIQKIKT